VIEHLPVGHAFISGQAQAPFANQRSRKAGIRSTSATVKVPPAARSGRRRLERHTSTRHPQIRSTLDAITSKKLGMQRVCGDC
jgi:hypothetical protein